MDYSHSMYELDLDWVSCGRPRQWAKNPTHPWISPGPDRSGKWQRHCLRYQPVAGRPSGTDVSAALSPGQTAGTDNKEGGEPRVQLITGYLLSDGSGAWRSSNNPLIWQAACSGHEKSRYVGVVSLNSCKRV